MSLSPGQLKVIIGSDVMLYSAKAPYERSGKSLQAVLVLDPVADLVQCHECGEWFENVGVHAWQDHQMRARDYKIKHGFNQSTALCNEALRLKFIDYGRRGIEALGMARAKANGKAGAAGGAVNRSQRPKLSLVIRNRNGTCPVQLPYRIREMAQRLGRTPKRAELMAAGIHAKSVEHVFGMKMREFIRSLGLLPNREPKRYSPEFLAERLLDFYVKNRRLPSQSDYNRGLLPSQSYFTKVFRGMENAYYAAGLSIVAEREKAERWRRFQQPNYTCADLYDLLRAFILRFGRRPMRREFGTAALKPSDKTFRRQLGSIAAACEKVELELRQVA